MPIVSDGGSRQARERREIVSTCPSTPAPKLLPAWSRCACTRQRLANLLGEDVQNLDDLRALAGARKRPQEETAQGDAGDARLSLDGEKARRAMPAAQGPGREFQGVGPRMWLHGQHTKLARLADNTRIGGIFSHHLLA